jgi:hypothetical protein
LEVQHGPKELRSGGLPTRRADNLKRAVPRITLLNAPLRHHEDDGSIPAESAEELGEDR